MSKKEKGKKSNLNKQDKNLEEILMEEIELQEKIEELQIQSKNLQKNLKEQSELTKNAQLQYLTIKNEFDAFSNRVQQNEKRTENEIFEKIILKIIPIIELFALSYEHLPDEIVEHKRSEWLEIINKKIWEFLNDSKIHIIATVWETPDESMHELIWTHPVEDKKQKWLIVTEVRKWYLIDYWDTKKTLIPAKVIIWE